MVGRQVCVAVNCYEKEKRHTDTTTVSTQYTVVCGAGKRNSIEDTVLSATRSAVHPSPSKPLHPIPLTSGTPTRMTRTASTPRREACSAVATVVHVLIFVETEAQKIRSP